MNFSTIPHVEHFEEKEFSNTLLCPIVASFDTESCSNTDITRRVNKNGVVQKSDERKKAEMVLVAVVATVIVRPNKTLNYTVYKDLSWSDDELLDYKSTVPWEIWRHIDVEDEANHSGSIDCFRIVMNEFMDLKTKTLRANMQKVSGQSIDQQRILDLELEEINKTLLKKRQEASRRFGEFFMEYFQALMEATKKNVAVCQKKNLSFTLAERTAFSKPLCREVEELSRVGLVNVTVSKLDGSFVGRQVGFSNLTTTNSVRQNDALNCKICNHKLDPLYIVKLQKYLEFKLTNPTHREGEEAKDEWTNLSDMSDVKENYYEMILDGQVVRVNREKPNGTEAEKQQQLEEEKRNQFDQFAVRSPHITIWAGCNEWHVKDRIFRFFCEQLNRYKQELIVAESRTAETYRANQGKKYQLHPITLRRWTRR